jgi:hypothetical protein
MEFDQQSRAMFKCHQPRRFCRAPSPAWDLSLLTSWRPPITGPSDRVLEVPRERTRPQGIDANGVTHISPGRQPWVGVQKIEASAEGAIHTSDEAGRLPSMNSNRTLVPTRCLYPS